jgi:hypothetical protein
VTNEVRFKKIYQVIWKTKFIKFLNKNIVVYAVKGFAEVCLYYINLAIIIKTLRKKLTETSKIGNGWFTSHAALYQIFAWQSHRCINRGLSQKL